MVTKFVIFIVPCMWTNAFSIPSTEGLMVTSPIGVAARKKVCSVCRSSQDDDESMDNPFEERSPAPKLDHMELAWRHVKKPMISIGAKGATPTHGNSLRQLLDAHTVVKVKIHTKNFKSLEAGFENLRHLAEESGAPKGIEMLQARPGVSTILCASPGTKERIEAGEFPP